MLVLGMHRSGTSALTRVLNILGAALPRHVLAADAANPAGYWEPARLVSLNDRMLEEAGSRWDDWRAFDPECLGAQRLADYRAEIRALIEQEYADAPLFALKDPRICRCLPLYDSILAAMGIATRYALVLREPASVLASLAARDGITPDYGSLLLIRHLTEVVVATRHRQRAIVSYEELVADPQRVATNLCEQLHLPAPEADAAPNLHGAVLKELQHHRDAPDAYPTSGPVAAARQLHAAVGRLSTDTAAYKDVEATRVALETGMIGGVAISDILAGEIASRGRRREHAVHHLQDQKRDLAAQVDLLTAERDRVEAENNRLTDQISSLSSSRALQLGRTTRHYLSLLNPGLFWGRRVALTPERGARQRNSREHATTWVFEGDDPQLRLALGSLPRGRYVLTLDLPGQDAPPAPADLYVDSGAGFSEAERLALDLEPRSPNRFVAVFELPEGAERLRFDPPAGLPELTIGTIRLRRITGAEHYVGATWRLLNEYRRTGRSLRAAISAAMRIVATHGPGGLARTISDKISRRRSVGTYQSWIARCDRLTPACVAALRSELAKLENPPKISVLMPVFNTPELHLREAIESVRSQIYENWELCIADDCSTHPHVATILKQYTAADDRIQVVFRPTNGHIAHASNSAFALVSGAWVALLDHDDVLRPHALAEVALAIARHPDAELIYSDEDKLSGTGVRFDPFFKPDFSRELFRSQNYLNHLTVHRARNIRAVGGWRPGFEGSQDYDLNLRVFEHVGGRGIRHIAKILYHWRAAPGSTALGRNEKTYAYEAGRRALAEHVQRVGLKAQVEEVTDAPFYRLRLEPPDPAPLVSLIVPTRDHADSLRTCVESIWTGTTYEPYEVLVVDNGSSAPDALRYLDELRGRPDVRVLRYDRPFNFSAINNFAVVHAQGEIIGLVNNDIEVISPDWLTEMVSWAAQPDIGCVGAKLYYPNDTIQHAGIILGIGGVAGHSHKHFPRDARGYFSRLQLVQNVSAVTGACLLVSKDVYARAGGLNEANLAVAFNDVDLCLRVRDLGLSNVWTPFAELYHHESLTRGSDSSPAKAARFQREVSWMQQRWTLEDSYYSPHLTREREDFSIAG